MSGFARIPPDSWELAIQPWLDSGEPWPEGLILGDLRYLEDQYRHGGRALPKLKELAERWGCTRYKADKLLKRVDWWAWSTAIDDARAMVDAYKSRAPKRTASDRTQTAAGQQSDGEQQANADNPVETGQQSDSGQTKSDYARGSSPESREQKTEETFSPPAGQLGRGVEASRITEPLWEAFTYWQIKQPGSVPAKLTKPRVHLLENAVKAVGVDGIKAILRLAYEAPVAPKGQGLPDSYARAWRGDSGQNRPGLETLMRMSKVERNAEIALAWLEHSAPTRPAPAHPIDTLSRNLDAGRVLTAGMEGDTLTRVRGWLSSMPDDRRNAWLRSMRGASADAWGPWRQAYDSWTPETASVPLRLVEAQ